MSGITGVRKLATEVLLFRTDLKLLLSFLVVM